MDRNQLYQHLFLGEIMSSQFESTKPGTREDRKAYFKNHNLPILQKLYQGSSDQMLTCSVTKTPAFVQWPCLVTGRELNRFRIDFNHIRQRALEGSQAGYSVDKDRYGPSDLFRSRRLDDADRKLDLIEFMTMMPISTEYHSYVSQSSQYGDITLENFDPKYWPWHLQSQANFNEIINLFDLRSFKITYEWMIDHLSNIDHDPIRARLG